MKQQAALYLFPALFLASFMTASASPPKHSPSEVLLVYNSNSPTSTAIANNYASKRSITNEVAVNCQDSALNSTNETISYANYTSQIATPISNYLSSHSGINFIVLTKGVPIRIDNAPTGSEPQGTSPQDLQPSVDSYLAAIDYPTITGAVKISITGSGATGYGWLNRYWHSTVPFSHATFGGYLVTRLDGYTQSDAMSLVTRALSAESGLTPYGRVLFNVPVSAFGLGDKTIQPIAETGTITQEENYGNMNSDMARAADLLEVSAIPYDFVEDVFVGNRSNLLGYFSWGSNDPAFSQTAYNSLTFAPGAIGETYVSTSARSLLPLNDGGQSLIADLIAQGITGIKGYTNEPLLDSNTSPTLALPFYMSGYSLAESYYVASRFVGWEDIVIGDPLCCPYYGNATSAPTQASSYNNASNVQTEGCSEGGLDVGFIGNGSYTEYNNINLTGIHSFEARVASPSAGTTISVCLDSPTATPVGVLTAPNTGDYQAWTDAYCSLTGASGIHNVYLVYTAGLNVQWFAFQGSGTSFIGTLPTPWVGTDIGSVGFAGSNIYSSATGNFTVTASGGDIWNNADAFHYVYQTTSGDTIITARVSTEGTTDPWSKAGVMIRNSLNPADVNAAIVVTPGNGVSFQWRSSSGSSSLNIGATGLTAPCWVSLIRKGNVFTGLYSSDGVTWTTLGSTTITMATKAYIGLASTSHNNGTVNTAAIDNVSIGTATLPSPWVGADIGSVGLTGGRFYTAGISTFTEIGSGADIWNTADAFHFIYQPVTRNCTMTARVKSEGNTDPWAKSGVMIRGALTANSVEASVLVTPGNAVTFQWRTTTGGSSSSIADVGSSAPIYVRIAQSGSSGTTFTGYYSNDGVTWTTIGSTTITMPSSFYAGLAVTSHNNSVTNTSTFDHVTLSILPSPWLGSDIGTVNYAGNVVYASGTYTISGSGDDIFNGADAFYYVHQSKSGNNTVTAQVTSEQYTDTNAKAGVMIRGTLAANSVEASVLVTPGNAITFQWRTSAGGDTTYIAPVGNSAPIYVRLKRSSNTFTGYYSSDGTTWTTIGSTTITMPTSVYTGLAVTSHNNGLINTSTLNKVSITSP